MVPPNSHKVPRASWYSGYRPAFAHFAYGTVTLCGLHVPVSHSAMRSESLRRSFTPFQVLFHSPPGVLFTFPSRYFSSIGHQVVFSLGGWSPLLPTRFLVPRGTPDTGLSSHIPRTGLLPSTVRTFQCFILLYAQNHSAGPLPPSTLL